MLTQNWNFAAALLLGLGLATGAAQANTGGAPEQGTFVSLKADRANLRTGPGKRYPVAWVYERPGLPLRVVDRWEHWREVEDPTGTRGWMHKSMLSTHHTAWVRGVAPVALRTAPRPDAQAQALVEPQVVVRVLACPTGEPFCRVSAAPYEGWVSRNALWGIAE